MKAMILAAILLVATGCGKTTQTATERPGSDISSFTIRKDGVAQVTFQDGTYELWTQELLGKKLLEHPMYKHD